MTGTISGPSFLEGELLTSSGKTAGIKVISAAFFGGLPRFLTVTFWGEPFSLGGLPRFLTVTFWGKPFSLGGLPRFLTVTFWGEPFSLGGLPRFFVCLIG